MTLILKVASFNVMHFVFGFQGSPFDMETRICCLHGRGNPRQALRWTHGPFQCCGIKYEFEVCVYIWKPFFSVVDR